MITSSTMLQLYHVYPLLLQSEKLLPPNSRLSEIRWKTTKEMKESGNTNKRPTLCVAVPTIINNISIQPNCIQQLMADAFMELQDTIIRSCIEEEVKKSSRVEWTSIIIPSEKLTFEGVAAFAAENSTSAKLSKEKLNNWFDAQLGEKLAEAFLVKNADIDKKRLENALTQHKEMIASLSAPKQHLPERIVHQLQTAINLADDDRIKSVLLDKLELMLKPKEAILDLGLL